MGGDEEVTIRFRVDGEPKGQPRVRAVRRGSHAGVFTPGTADGWKSCVKMAALPHRPEAPIDAAVGVRLIVLFKRPGRLMRAKTPAGRLRHTGAIDADNAAKAVLDALTDIGLWVDDRQVCELRVEKWYAAKGERTGAEIEVEILSD